MPNNQDKKIERVIKMLEAADKDFPTHEEVAEIIQVVLEKIELIKEEMANNIAEMDSGMSEKHQKMMAEMEREMDNLAQRLEGLKQSTDRDSQSITKQLMSEVKRVEAMIPEKADFREVYSKISEVEKKILPFPDLPKELNAKQIVDKINDSDELIDKERVEGLEDLIKELRKEIRTASSSGGSPRRIYQPKLDRFKDQCDGSNKTFYLSREPLATDTIEVSGTDFPIILDPTVDFTVSGKTLTLTSAVPAPNTGSTLLCKYYT